MYHHGVVTTDPRSMCRPESWKLRYMDVFHHCGWPRRFGMAKSPINLTRRVCLEILVWSDHLYNHGEVVSGPRSMCRPESCTTLTSWTCFIIAGDHEGLTWQSHPSISSEGYVWRQICGQIIFIIMVWSPQTLGACADLKVSCTPLALRLNGSKTAREKEWPLLYTAI